MFIDPGKIKRVEVNNENIEYYNNIYENMRSEKLRQKKRKPRQQKLDEL